MTRIFLILLLLLSATVRLYSQNFTVEIKGPTAVAYDGTATYSVEYRNSSGQIVTAPSSSNSAFWAAGPGDVVSPSADGTSAVIRFTTQGARSVTYEYLADEQYTAWLIVTVGLTEADLPRPETNYSSEYSCGSTTLTRTSSPPANANYLWWWQTTPTGTSTALGSGPSITVNQPQTFYLRSRTKTTPYQWSNGSSPSITIATVYSMPSPVTSVSNLYIFKGTHASPSVVTQSPAQVIYYSADGVALSGGPGTAQLSSTTSFKASTKNGPCISSVQLAFTVFVTQPPVILAENGQTSVASGVPVTLKVDHQFDSYEWRDSNGALVGTASSLSTTTRGWYYVTVTKNGVLGSGVSPRVFVSDGFIKDDQNYIITSDVRREGITDENQLKSLDAYSLMQSVQFVDGLGVPLQNVQLKSSPTFKDIVQPIEYDPFGRETRKFLPYAVPPMENSYHAFATKTAGNQYVGSEQQQFYQGTDAVATDPVPYAETVFEESPLNRPVLIGVSGQAWQSRKIEYRYETNQSADVFMFKLRGEDVAFAGNGGAAYYAPNQLLATRTFDEHGRETIEFTDIDDKIVLRRVEHSLENNVKQYAETYFIYDDFDNLVTVFPPEAVLKIKKSIGQQ